MRVVAVIPARLASTRLPQKVLGDIAGMPMLWHVWQAVRCATVVDDLCVATDSHEVMTAVQSWGGQALLTSRHCRSGTERIASILDQLDAEFVINVQADEPLLHPSIVESLVRRWIERQCPIVTPVFRITTLEELENPAVVKVVRAATGRAMYFSRAAIPFVRDLPRTLWLSNAAYWGHVGVYGFARDVLSAYALLPPSSLEDIEKLEQLRFVEAGYNIDTVETLHRPFSVDTPEDLEEVRNRILARNACEGNRESSEIRIGR
jgi:3-deoxy-manno-octulosonate cytidylyltransferase (CMP-KDO synthetase)